MGRPPRGASPPCPAMSLYLMGARSRSARGSFTIPRRRAASRWLAQEARGYFPDLVLQTVVPRNVRLSESPSFGKPILLYDIKSKGCESYLALGRELMQREKEHLSRQVVA